MRSLTLDAKETTEDAPDDLEQLSAEVASDPVARAAYEDAVGREALVLRLVEARKQRSLTQSDLADQLKTSQSVISALENQRTDARLSTLQQHARASGHAITVTLQDPSTGKVSKWLPIEAASVGPEWSTTRFSGIETHDDDLLELTEDVRDDPVAFAAYVDASRRSHVVASLVSARRHLGLTQSDVAVAIGAGQSAVSELENGRSDARLSALQRYARACDLVLVASLDEDATLRGMVADLALSHGIADPVVVDGLNRTASATVGRVLRGLIKTENQPGVPLTSVLSALDLASPAAHRTARSLASRGWLAYSEDERLSLIPDAATFVGISIRPNHVRGLVTRLDAKDFGEVYRLPLDDTSPGSVIRTVVELIQLLLPHAEQPLGVGVELAGPVRGDTGTVVFAPDLQPHTKDSWDNFMLEAELQDRLDHLKVVVANDATALATRELLQHGDPGGLIVVTLSESTKGIGAGLVLDGKVFTGADGQAGEIGHLRVPRNHRVCPRCGKDRKGCLETIASGYAIAREMGAEDLVAASILAERGDPEAVAAFRRGGRALGRVIGDAVTWLDAARVVIFGTPQLAGGPAVPSARLFSEGVTAGLAKRSLTKTDYPEYVTLDDWLGPQAAAAVAVNDFLDRPLEYTNDMVARTHSATTGEILPREVFTLQP